MKDIDQYKVHCIKCGTSDDMMLVPNRNGKGEMVGWHFVCPNCINFVLGKATRTMFGEEDIDVDPNTSTIN